MQQTDFDHASNSIVVGYSIAEKIFGKAEKAIGKTVRLKNSKPALIIGVIEKQGTSMMNMWDYDNSIIMAHGFMKQMTRIENSQPRILVEGKENTVYRL